MLNSVLDFLDLPDACNLRLASKEIAAKSAQGTFRIYFSSRTLYVNSFEKLDDFSRIMQQPDSLALRLRNLTILGIASCTDELGMDSGEDEGPAVALIIHGFTKLADQGILESLSLTLHDPSLQTATNSGRRRAKTPRWRYADRSWERAWATACLTYRRAIRAVISADLPIQKLDIFASTPGYSLALDRLHGVLQDYDLEMRPCLGWLRELSLSVSHRVAHETNEQDSQVYATDVAKFLRHCPAIERFALHWYNLYWRNLTSVQQEDRRVMKDVARLTFAHLRHVELSGVYCDPDTLLAFAQHNVHLRTLRLENVSLEGEVGLQPFLDYMTSQMQDLENFELVNLWELNVSRNSPICFQIPGEPRMPITHTSNGPHEVRRSGSEVHLPLRYRAQDGRMVQSSAELRWREALRDKFGPPSRS